MNVEEWLEFLGPDDIRIKGTRVGVETVLYDYIHRSRTPEEMVEDYPSLTLAQAYAVLFYYHTHKEEMDRYVADWLEWGFQQRAKQAQDPYFQALGQRLRARKAELDARKALS